MGKVVKKKEDKAEIATPTARNDKVGEKARKDKRQDSSAAVGMTRERVSVGMTRERVSVGMTRQEVDVTRQEVDVTRQEVDVTRQEVDVTRQKCCLTEGVVAGCLTSKKSGCDDKNKKFVDKYNLGGRPKAFSSPQEMIEKMTAYFLKQESIVIGHTKDGVYIYRQGPINIQGMCAFMGITNQTLNEYAKDKKYKAIIAQAKMICEGHLVDLCCSSKDHKADFVLKNNYKEDWKDETSTKLSGDIDVGERLKKLLGKD